MARGGLYGFLGTSRWNDTAILFIRVLIGIMMMVHGLAKIQNFGTLSHTFPDPIGWGSNLSLILIILTEVGGSLFLIIGLLTRPAALVLAIGMFVATFVVGAGKITGAQELSFIYMGIYITLFISGGGRYAMDRLLFR